MKQGYSFLLVLLVVVGLNACSTPHYLYNPTAVNVSGFIKKNEASVTAALSGNGFDVQGGYAISNHWAIMGSWYWRRGHGNYDYPPYIPTGINTITIDSVYYHCSLFSVAGSYFSPIDSRKKYFLFIQAGYGRGRLRMPEHHIIKLADTILTNHLFHYKARMNRILFQPSVMRKGRSLDIIFSLRLSGMLYNHIQSDYPPYEIQLKENKLYIFKEPALTFIIHPNLNWLAARIQFGLAIPSDNVSFEIKPFIGNIGFTVYPQKWFLKKQSEF